MSGNNNNNEVRVLKYFGRTNPICNMISIWIVVMTAAAAAVLWREICVTMTSYLDVGCDELKGTWSSSVSVRTSERATFWIFILVMSFVSKAYSSTKGVLSMLDWMEIDTDRMLALHWLIENAGGQQRHKFHFLLYSSFSALFLFSGYLFLLWNGIIYLETWFGIDLHNK